MSHSRIAFVVTGSIAAFKAAQVVSRLVQDGHEVRVVATPAALKFVGAATFEGLTGRPVLTDLWESGSAMEHIHLSRWADIGVICPASANTMAHMALGLAEDLAGALTLAWPVTKPLHVFPAMNSLMLSHPATQEHIETLTNRGVIVHPTAGGNLACGEFGSGRLLEPDEIIARIQPVKLGKILVTAGATREPVDGIRFISNVSTGRTGAALAERLSALGWEVTLLRGTGAVEAHESTRTLTFSSFSSLDSALQSELATNNYAAVVHAAAVSDYSVAAVNGAAVDEEMKLPSSGELTLQFKTNPKLLPQLRQYSANKSIRVIGFKLTVNKKLAETESIARDLLGSDVHAVVANDWSNVSATAHSGSLVTAQTSQPFESIHELGNIIHQYLVPFTEK